MTCIATDGKTMAGDGLVTDQGVIVSRDDLKIERLPDGRLYGAAGDWAGCQMIREWLVARANGERHPAAFPTIKEETTALVVNLDGSIIAYYESGGGQATRLTAPAAIGSGMLVALGAMDAGASPLEAVRIASYRIPTVGGELAVLGLIGDPE